MTKQLTESICKIIELINEHFDKIDSQNDSSQTHFSQTLSLEILLGERNYLKINFR